MSLDTGVHPTMTKNQNRYYISQNLNDTTRLIVDDVLPYNVYNELYSEITHYNFIWHLQQGRVGLSCATDKDYEFDKYDWRFQHILYPDEYVFKFVQVIHDCLQVQLVHCEERINCEVRKDTRTYSEYHTDLSLFPSPFYTCIYNFTTCDGGTQFAFDEKIIKSKANRLIIFPSHLAHRGVGQTDTQHRFVINMNLLLNSLPLNAQHV